MAQSDKLIKASLSVSRASLGKAPNNAGDDRLGRMTYHESTGRDFEYEPSQRLPDALPANVLPTNGATKLHHAARHDTFTLGA